MSLSEFRQLLQQDQLDLPAVSLLFARHIAYPTLDVNYYLLRLDDLAAAAGRRLDLFAPLSMRAEQLATFLFEESQYRGNAADYGDPRNSFLNDVLDRRLGIPISLSVLYLAVAARLDLPAYGVGLPGHFVVGVPPAAAEPPLLVDPFYGGRFLTRSDCARLIAQTSGYRGPFLPQWLDPTPPRLILTRMLNNLRLGYFGRQEWGAAERTLHLLRLVQPDMGEHLRDLGLVALKNGRMQQAARYLEDYLALTPTPADADAVRQAVTPQMEAWGRKN